MWFVCCEQRRQEVMSNLLPHYAYTSSAKVLHAQHMRCQAQLERPAIRSGATWAELHANRAPEAWSSRRPDEGLVTLGKTSVLDGKLQAASIDLHIAVNDQDDKALSR